MIAVTGRVVAGSRAGPELLRKFLHIAFGIGALTLRWLQPWEAATLVLAALAFNAVGLHRLTRGRLLRTDELQRGLSWGVLGYPAAVLGCILVFRQRLELAAGVWGLLALGDGMAAVAGVLGGGRPLPWNSRKTWIGTTAFVLWGTAAAAFLIRWTQYGVLDAAVAGDPTRGEVVGGSFLASFPGATAVSQPAFLLFGCLAASALAALAESVDTSVDDNVRVALVGGAALYAATLVEPQRLATAAGTFASDALFAAVVTAALALAGWVIGGVDAGGAACGWLLGTTLWACAGWRGFTLLALLFALGTAATRMGRERKTALGIAQGGGGRRGASHALANSLAGVAAAVLAAVTPYRDLFTLALVAGFATATCDTLSSEIGQAFARFHVALIGRRRVAAGTEGAVSILGTVAGVVGAALVALWAALSGLIGWSLAPAVIAGAAIGAMAESVVGELAVAGRWRIGNHTLNLGNTIFGAIAACSLAALFG